MNYIEESIPISIAQISYSTPSTNKINPLEVIVGRNQNFTDIRRMYVKVDVSGIPVNAIISSAYLRMVVLHTQDYNASNNANLMGFLVTSTVTNIDNVTWNNMPSFDIFSSFYNEDIHGNSIIKVDVTNYIKGFIKGTIANNGFIFVNNEAVYNEVIIDGDMHESVGLELIVEYYNPAASFVEQTINVNQSGNLYTTAPVLTSYIENGTMFIINLGTAPITAYVDISGNGVDFVEDNTTGPILPSLTKPLIPYYWAKYIRVRLIGTEGFIKGTIILQGHYA